MIKTEKSDILTWINNGVFICEKCGHKGLKIYPDETKKYDIKKLKDDLKDALKDQGLWGPTRVALSDCLGVCPKGLVTVVFVNKNHPPETITIDPKEDKKELMQIILDRAQKIKKD